MTHLQGLGRSETVRHQPFYYQHTTPKCIKTVHIHQSKWSSEIQIRVIKLESKDKAFDYYHIGAVSSIGQVMETLPTTCLEIHRCPERANLKKLTKNLNYTCVIRLFQVPYKKSNRYKPRNRIRFWAKKLNGENSTWNEPEFNRVWCEKMSKKM